MRILHVMEVSDGGVISVANAYISAQIAARHDVHLLAPTDAKITNGAGYTRHPWRPERHTPWRFPAAVRDLRTLIAALEPDVVHLHSFFAGGLGRFLPRQLGDGRPAIVYQPHSWAFEAAPTALGRWIVTRWEKFAARRTDTVIVNCQDEFQEGLRHGVIDQAQIVGVPVDVGHFAPVPIEERRRLRGELGVSTQQVVLCVGRICPQKGQDRLVSAWAREPIPGATLVILGRGDTGSLEKAGGSEWGRSIRAVGSVIDVRPWLHVADLCAMPSRYEGQSVAMAEALACGRPVVATKVNGAREAIEDGPEPAAGAVVEQGDMSAFLIACRRRLGDPALLAIESAAARTRAQRIFADDAVMQRVSSAYALAVGRSARLARQER